MKLSRNFYAQKTLLVAQELLGKYLVVKTHKFNRFDTVGSDLVGKIVESEAYIGTNDKASHANWRRRETCAVMWGTPGQAYVYFIYGVHWMLNFVTEKENYPAAVLIRALEPVEGISLMAKNRGFRHQKFSNLNSQFSIADGPAKLTQALGIDGSFNGDDLVTSKRIWVEDRRVKYQRSDIKYSQRIGVDYAGPYKNRLWRFYLKDSPFVSRR